MMKVEGRRLFVSLFAMSQDAMDSWQRSCDSGEDELQFFREILLCGVSLASANQLSII